MTDKTSQLPGLLWGLLVGSILTPLLISLFYIGERFASLPFIPLNFFDWLARVLPGQLLTFGIDTMVDLLIATGFGDNLDSAAKIAERILGLGIFFGLTVITVGIFFWVLGRIEWRADNHVPGIVYALLFGGVIMFLAIPVSVASAAAPLMKVLWSGLLFLGFGLAIDWTYHQLCLVQKKQDATQVTNGVDRRQFLVTVGGVSATLTVVGGAFAALFGGDGSEPSPNANLNADNTVVDNSSTPNDLPNADSAVVPAPGTRPELTPVRDFYRIDILSGGLPSIPEDWTLPITGLVANEVNWTLDELKAMPSQSAYITMSCISNRVGGSLISTTKWTGVPFSHILEQVEPAETAQAVRIVGYDNFDEYVDLDLLREDDRIMLAYHFDDQDLPLRNGYPLRIHIPNRYGMKQPKWIRSIEFIDAWEPGYWVRRSWSRDAIVNATSVIDTVAVDEAYEANGQTYVPMGGIAWAGDRPIVAVDVRIDGGTWQAAELREPISDRTWTLWRYNWLFEEGDHTVEVRAYEAAPEGQSDPILQPTQTRGTRPDGATGIDEYSYSAI